MWGLGVVGVGCAYIGWRLVFFSLMFAAWAWWLPFCLSIFFALVFLGLAWRALHFAVNVALGLTTTRLAWRDFKNSLADWLVSARTGFKD